MATETISLTNGHVSHFPPIKFNTTLHELFSKGADGPLTDTLCVLKPNSDPKYGDTIPFNAKYIIHAAQVGTADDLAHLYLEINGYLLMFYAGPMSVVMMGCEGKTTDQTLTKEVIEKNSERSFGAVNKAQRPRPVTYRNIEDFTHHHDGSKIHWAFATDFAEHLPSINHASHVFKLNSKRWLADCDLKSANDTIIDCTIPCPDHATDEGLWYYGGKDCSFCENGIDGQIERTREMLNTRPPFVLKLTQSLSSVGTNIVQNASDRQQVIADAETYLRQYLPKITQENAALQTTSLILSDFIQGETMALNFFVHRDGTCEFLGACHQLATGESGRQATAITYADQEKLKDKYQPILDQIGQTLHAESYYGPCGADIMENPDDGTLFTIDLNVRCALSFVLYLLRGHVNGDHGLGMSLVYECIMLKIDRDTFEDKFGKEFMESRIILMGSARMGDKEQWAYGIIVAGNSQEELDRLSDRILEFEIDGGQGELAEAAG